MIVILKNRKTHTSEHTSRRRELPWKMWLRTRGGKRWRNYCSTGESLSKLHEKSGHKSHKLQKKSALKKQGRTWHERQGVDSKLEGNIWQCCRQSLLLRNVICRKSLQVKDLLLICFSISFSLFQLLGQIRRETKQAANTCHSKRPSVLCYPQRPLPPYRSHPNILKMLWKSWRPKPKRKRKRAWTPMYL